MTFLRSLFVFLILVLLGAGSCKKHEAPEPAVRDFKLISYAFDGLQQQTTYQNTSLLPQITLSFSDPVDHQTTQSGIVMHGSSNVPLSYAYSHHDCTVVVIPSVILKTFTPYLLTVTAQLWSQSKVPLAPDATVRFVTRIDSTDKFPRISDSDLLDSIQKRTIRYFYDFAEPNSGMARERDTSGDLVTSGGTGFGLMTLVVGIERGFIPRPDGIARFNKVVSFLETADRFHGAWPHWMHGASGTVIPFSPTDDGADLVETSFLAQGLITVREYLKRTPSDTSGNNLINRIDQLWQDIEFDWFQNGQDVLFWHWSPKFAWTQNVPVRGYNEALIVYVLAASSPSHGISASVYQKGWASQGGIKNGRAFYGYPLPLGPDYGGPLFFAHYSFLGFSPHITDTYLGTDYWTQNVNHTLINRAYCVDNPRRFSGYSEDSWGLTASDNPSGYGAQSPTSDNGTITPTAAISSIPYTPNESLQAIRFFYYTMGDRLWGPYGFRDAINYTEGWVAPSYLAIDQGPIVIMIENYRTGKLWDLFMSAPEIAVGKSKLGME